MSRIDELQRLHEAATPGEWRDISTAHREASLPRPIKDARHNTICSVGERNYPLIGAGAVLPHSPHFAQRCRDAEQIVALHNSWPAIHRVLVAARKWDEAPLGSVAEVTAALELSQALRALDGGLPADQ